MANISEISKFIWDISDSVLRGTYKRNEYQNVILPFVVLKRFDSVLDYSKQAVIDTYEEYKDKTPNWHPIVKEAAIDENGNELGFYNYSPFNIQKLLENPDQLEENIDCYLKGFSDNIKDIFKNFKIENEIETLLEADRLYYLLKKFAQPKIDLSPKNISNHNMGTLFEELVRKFSETSNEEAGEHFTPRDVVKLMTELLLAEEIDNDSENIKMIYDPACGTGGMLTSCKEFINDKYDNMNVLLYGQELNPRIYAVCKADMLMKGEQAENIKGPISTLSHDQLPDKKFHYIISNPPYGTDWKADKDEVKNEHDTLGFEGRFGAGLPRVNDGQLLFIQLMISKMKTNEKSRIAVITNASPLFNGDAGSNESNIRKWIFDNDYLETLIALPDQLFFNTGIGTYIWILTNKKEDKRQGKVQLIDARDKYAIRRKSLGKKRHDVPDESINSILNEYHEFTNGEHVKIFDNADFGFTKITVDRPKQFNYQITPERVENLYSYNKFNELSISENEDLEIKEEEELKGKEIQNEIKQSLLSLPDTFYKDWKDFAPLVEEALEPFDLTDNFIENIILSLAEHDETAEYVTTKAGEYRYDPKLRDYERISLKQNIDEYFEKKVLAYYPDAWYDSKKNVIGYKVNFTQYFYTYKPPRPLEEIEADVNKVTEEIQELLKE